MQSPRLLLLTSYSYRKAFLSSNFISLSLQERLSAFHHDDKLH